jgi:hypothetical protein
MGCDIHVRTEVRRDGIWREVSDPIFPGDWFDRQHDRAFADEPFGWRSYRMFTFFAGVRDYHEGITPLSGPRGVPADASPGVRKFFGVGWGDFHSHSWLSVTDLTSVDYTDDFRDRIGVGDDYFAHLDVLKSLGAPDDVRIVFAFDN